MRLNLVKVVKNEATAAMAEWLRRLTRNQLGYSLAGSNPARSVVSIAIKKSCAALKQMFSSFILYAVINEAMMAEWLRRLTRNQMGYSLAGSNPARSAA